MARLRAATGSRACKVVASGLDEGRRTARAARPTHEEKPMTTTATTAEQKTFPSPNETRTFEHGLVDLVDIAGTQIGRLTLQPGWRWSEHVKPIACTELCEGPHFQYHVQGHLRIR